SRAGSVVAGSARSTTEISAESWLDLRLRDAFASEHTAIAVTPTAELLDHSRSAWDNSAIDGTRNRTLPPAPTYSSANRSEVKVFPVPQAMINRPRSAVSNPAVTSSIAVR